MADAAAQVSLIVQRDERTRQPRQLAGGGQRRRLVAADVRLKRLTRDAKKVLALSFAGDRVTSSLLRGPIVVGSFGIPN